MFSSTSGLATIASFFVSDGVGALGTASKTNAGIAIRTFKGPEESLLPNLQWLNPYKGSLTGFGAQR